MFTSFRIISWQFQDQCLLIFLRWYPCYCIWIHSVTDAWNIPLISHNSILWKSQSLGRTTQTDVRGILGQYSSLRLTERYRTSPIVYCERLSAMYLYFLLDQYIFLLRRSTIKFWVNFTKFVCVSTCPIEVSFNEYKSESDLQFYKYTASHLLCLNSPLCFSIKHRQKHL